MSAPLVLSPPPAATAPPRAALSSSEPRPWGEGSVRAARWSAAGPAHGAAPRRTTGELLDSLEQAAARLQAEHRGGVGGEGPQRVIGVEKVEVVARRGDSPGHQAVELRLVVARKAAAQARVRERQRVTARRRGSGRGGGERARREERPRTAQLLEEVAEGRFARRDRIERRLAASAGGQAVGRGDGGREGERARRVGRGGEASGLREPRGQLGAQQPDRAGCRGCGGPSSDDDEAGAAAGNAPPPRPPSPLPGGSEHDVAASTAAGCGGGPQLPQLASLREGAGPGKQPPWPGRGPSSGARR
eukprot:CAMPEP_0202735840 /NCGR_PEP_ID=MMETSP1388-20130828/648_1 /ASSEMBLY_ACC=CAM_ASM_000864 /TAXON_ID=37098 /ORGANISM="Isochrysis sp, Strain CCMP1244" /LENGTH=302 /DNA_ID=CAMNT_0049402305 /DNA_START=198 /DNA_END=1105 /DNA_ORIENTATION=+